MALHRGEVPAGVAGGLSVTPLSRRVRLGYGPMVVMLEHASPRRGTSSACETEDVDATTEECLTPTDDDGETYAYRAPAMVWPVTDDGRSGYRWESARV